MNDYFEIPTQVMFWDEGEGKYAFGIGYRDEIICGCCGGIFEIEDIVAETPSGQQPIYSYGDDWTDLSEEIFGGEYPDDYPTRGQV